MADNVLVDEYHRIKKRKKKKEKQKTANIFVIFSFRTGDIIHSLYHLGK